MGLFEEHGLEAAAEFTQNHASGERKREGEGLFCATY